MSKSFIGENHEWTINRSKIQFRKSVFEVIIFEDAIQAVTYLDLCIDQRTVDFGGSMKLEEMNLYKILSQHNQVFWHQRLTLETLSH